MKISKTQEITLIFPDISTSTEARLEILIGRLLCSNMRDLLESEVFTGRPIRWREGKGWIERIFTIIGPPAHVEQVRQRIAHWAEAIEARAK